MSLKNELVSEKCLKFGIPALCYHLFPACDQGTRKPRLCKEECVKLKTEVCNTEISLIKKFSEDNLKTMFPECSNLPNAGSQEGSHCVKLGTLSRTCWSFYLCDVENVPIVLSKSIADACSYNVAVVFFEKFMYEPVARPRRGMDGPDPALSRT